jgi:hypothetical protein
LQVQQVKLNRTHGIKYIVVAQTLFHCLHTVGGKHIQELLQCRGVRFECKQFKGSNWIILYDLIKAVPVNYSRPK